MNISEEIERVIEHFSQSIDEIFFSIKDLHNGEHRMKNEILAGKDVLIFF